MDDAVFMVTPGDVLGMVVCTGLVLVLGGLALVIKLGEWRGKKRQRGQGK